MRYPIFVKIKGNNPIYIRANLYVVTSASPRGYRFTQYTPCPLVCDTQHTYTQLYILDLMVLSLKCAYDKGSA